MNEMDKIDAEISAQENEQPMTQDEKTALATGEAIVQAQEAALPTDHIPADYIRDHPQYGADAPQSIHRFGDVGATVTRWKGQYIVQPIKYVGMEITNFVHEGEQEFHGAIEAVMKRLHQIKGS